MGAESSVQRDGKSQEDGSASASAGELSAEVTVLQEGGSALESKVQPSFLDPFLLTPLSAAGTNTNPRERCYFNIYLSIYICTFSGKCNASWCLLYRYQFFFIVHLRVCKHPPSSPSTRSVSHFVRISNVLQHPGSMCACRCFFFLLSHGVELSAVPQ